MHKFIYVFSRKDGEKLLSLGYRLMKYDETQDIWIFLNDEHLSFEKGDMSYAMLDTLSF